MTTGRLRVLGERIALLDECDDELRCETRWVDIDSFETVDLPIPAELEQWDSMRLVAQDRYPLIVNFESRSQEVFEVATGETVRSLDIREQDLFRSAVPISDDGRWLIDLSEVTKPPVVDLTKGKEWALPSELAARQEIGIIVDLSETAFASPVWQG